MVEPTAVARRRGTPTENAGSTRSSPRCGYSLSSAVLRSARATPSRPPLRALHLLHLATARQLRGESGLDTLIAYDRELCDAAEAEDFTALVPI